jgi:ketosteroid isomerase-like protein
VGWFPSDALFSTAAADQLAGSSGSTSNYSVDIEAVDLSGDLAAVHDIWRETRRYSNGNTVERIIRGSELWKRQNDGSWRIVRWVSAPEAWARKGD